jgi:hypothetical protein
VRTARKARGAQAHKQERRSARGETGRRRRHRVEMRNAAECPPPGEQQRQRRASPREELRKRKKEIEAAREAVKGCRRTAHSDTKALEEGATGSQASLWPMTPIARPASGRPGIQDVQLGGSSASRTPKAFRAHAALHGINVPTFTLRWPGDDVPQGYRPFIGVVGQPRADGPKLVIIITPRRQGTGARDGYWTYGPPGPTGGRARQRL